MARQKSRREALLRVVKIKDAIQASQATRPQDQCVPSAHAAAGAEGQELLRDEGHGVPQVAGGNGAAVLDDMEGMNEAQGKLIAT